MSVFGGRIGHTRRDMEQHLYQVVLAISAAGVVGLVKHILSDIKYRQKVDDLAKRVSKLDGINGR